MVNYCHFYLPTEQIENKMNFTNKIKKPQIINTSITQPDFVLSGCPFLKYCSGFDDYAQQQVQLRFDLANHF